MWFPYTLLGVFCWASLNVTDSLLVKNYEKKPMVLLWSQSLFSIPILCVIPLLFDVRSSWAWVLALGGLLDYGADFVFFYVLDRIDISVTNIAWAILSVYLSIAGFLLFGESWTGLQAIGAVLILGGLLMISLTHWHVSFAQTIVLLALLALVFTPHYIIRKAALLHSQSVIAVFFWPLVSRESICILSPFFLSPLRASIAKLVRRVDVMYYVISGFVIACFLGGELTGALAYAHGPISLISITSNIQPFVVLFLAWLLWRLVPSYASKELLTLQSVRVKIVSFVIVFAGLALLVI